MKKIKIAFCLNLCIFLLEVLANLWMVSGIHIFSDAAVLSASKLAMLRYFTVDSNILMGIVALVSACYYKKMLSNNSTSVPKSLYVWQLLGTVSVTLTLLVTVFFLVPTANYPWTQLFADSNFLLHLVNPLLSIVAFVCYEKVVDAPFKTTFIGIVPMLLYAVYYVGAAVTHTTNGVIDFGYDWYGFFFAGLKSGFIVVPIIIVFTYLISLVLWKLNKSFIKE